MTSYINNIIDDDDEFGGATNSVAKIFRKRETVAMADDDDEFGGAVNTVEKIFRRGDVETTSKPLNNKFVKSSIVETDYSPIHCEHKIFCPPLSNNQWWIDREKLSDCVKDVDTALPDVMRYNNSN